MINPSIKHVFVLALENRSFDHMLGFSGITGIDAATGAPTRINGLKGTESNPYNGKTYPVTRTADPAMASDPGHEFENILEQLAGPGVAPPLQPAGQYPAIHGTGFVSSFVRTGGTANPGEIMKCCDPAQVPVLVSLAREFAVCDSWFSSLPGPTWPNRFFMVAGSSGGLDHSPTNAEMVDWGAVQGFQFQHGTIFDQKKVSWRIYAGGALAIVQALKGIEFPDVHPFVEFTMDVHSGAKPYDAQFTFLEPNYGDVVQNYQHGDSQHPLDGVTGGERLIKQVYEALRTSPIWNSSLLIVTWDEHGGFYDHVPPPAAPSPGDTYPTPQANQWGFRFNQYGVRVPAVVVSPLIPKNLIDHRLYDHTSILATVEAQFGMAPFTERDRQARSVLPLASLSKPRSTPVTLPQPAAVNETTQAAPPDPRGTAHTGNLPGFMGIALRTSLHLAPPGERDALIARWKTVATRGDASQFFAEVLKKVEAARKPPKLP